MIVIKKFVKINYKIHIVIAFVIRLVLTAYGVYYDQKSRVQYTDIDYKVFTDGARYVVNHQSPYLRHTFRYSPLIAFLAIPNIKWHICFGKFLFAIFDILDALLIRAIIKNTMQEFYINELNSGSKEIEPPDNVNGNSAYRGRRKSKHKSNRNNINSELIEFNANLGLVVWLYNPLTIAISTRGSCDSIAGFLVLATLYLIQCKKTYFLAGLMHGLSIHFRLYPLVYSLALFMYLSNFSFYSVEDRRKSPSRAIENSNNEGTVVVTPSIERRTIFKKKYLYYLIPNLDQILLISGTIISLSFLTVLFYYLYGYEFVYETYLYHFIRNDIRHNFSLYFYLQYLTAWIRNIGVWQRVLTILPQLSLLVVFSFRYGLNRFSLNFSILTQTIVLVAYNTVMTSQYFVWILVVLPLCLWQIKIPLKNTLFLIGIWLAAQGAWLLPAYFLEFHGQNTFLFIWIQSVSFFCANIAILGRLIMKFMPPKPI